MGSRTSKRLRSYIDFKEKYVTPTGLTINLYPISVVCEALYVTKRTLSYWETSGKIPHSWFVNDFGMRLYSTEMIRIINEALFTCNMTPGGHYSKPRGGQWARFTNIVNKKFAELAIKYFGEDA